MSEVTVTVTENGSYKVTGGVTLLGADGEPVPGGDRDPIFLCRCGGSSNKPFAMGALQIASSGRWRRAAADGLRERG